MEIPLQKMLLPHQIRFFCPSPPSSSSRLLRPPPLLRDEKNGGSFLSCPCPSSSDANSNSDLILTPLFDFSFLPQSPLSSYTTTVLRPPNTGVYCVINTGHKKTRNFGGQERLSTTNQFILCNPTTREYRLTIPIASQTPAGTMNWDTHHGFGHVCNKSGEVLDYKLVIILISSTYSPQRSPKQQFRFESFVYSLRRGSWEKIAEVRYGAEYDGANKAIAGLVNGRGEVETPRFIMANRFSPCRQLFLNGSWHWLEMNPRVYVVDRVLFFDVVEEVFGVIAAPPVDYGGERVRVLGGLSLLHDHLAAVIYALSSSHDRIETSATLEVWMMTEYGVEGSWTRIYSCEEAFNPSSWFGKFSFSYYATITSNQLHTHKVLLSDLFGSRKLVYIDGSRFEEFKINSRREISQCLVGSSMYVESLESLTLSHC